jgi:hypothetical protein
MTPIEKWHVRERKFPVQIWVFIYHGKEMEAHFMANMYLKKCSCSDVS